MKKNYKGLVTVAVIAMITIFSCDKNLNKTNPNAVTVDAYFNTSAQLLNATNSIYSTLHSPSLVGREWFFLHDLRSDEVSAGGGQLEVPRAQILNGSVDPTNPVMNSVWNALYTMIHRANTVTDNATHVTDNDALKNRCVGEAKFLRAWAYFELVTMWGGVPVYNSTVKDPDAYQSRVKEDDVYTFIIKDLQDAVAALPAKSAIEKGRATNAAANAMLGRVYMQKGDYAAAKAALLKIPVSGNDGYTLAPRYLDNFEEETDKEFNNESIFEVVFNDKGDNNFNWGGNSVGDGPSADQSTVRNQEYCPVAWRNLIPSNKFLNEFENVATGAAKTDPRFAWSVYLTGDTYNNQPPSTGPSAILKDGDQNGNTSVINGATIKASWRKYMLLYKMDLASANFHPGGNNQRMIRFAEVLLMLAECENETGNMQGAIGYLNQVRDRTGVGMPHYPTAQFPAASKDQVTKAIMHERMVELGDEELRNIDIIRWRKKNYFTTDPLSYFKAGRDELLPIPQTEIDNNPKLGEGGVARQNPGY